MQSSFRSGRQADRKATAAIRFRWERAGFLLSLHDPIIRGVDHADSQGPYFENPLQGFEVLFRNQWSAFSSKFPILSPEIRYCLADRRLNRLFVLDDFDQTQESLSEPITLIDVSKKSEHLLGSRRILRHQPFSVSAGDSTKVFIRHLGAGQIPPANDLQSERRILLCGLVIGKQDDHVMFTAKQSLIGREIGSLVQ